MSADAGLRAPPCQLLGDVEVKYGSLDDVIKGVGYKTAIRPPLHTFSGWRYIFCVQTTNRPLPGRVTSNKSLTLSEPRCPSANWGWQLRPTFKSVCVFKNKSQPRKCLERLLARLKGPTIRSFLSQLGASDCTFT